MHRQPPCPSCGHWKCSACGFTRPYASRFAAQVCRCGGRAGIMLPLRHQAHERAEEHLIVAAYVRMKPVYPMGLASHR